LSHLMSNASHPVISASRSIVYQVEAVFRVPRGQKLGLTFQTAKAPATGVTVLSLKDEGVISEWNKAHPAHERIVSGVNIVSWNGQSGTARHFYAAIQECDGEIRLLCLTGPRHHPGIRRALQRVYNCFDVDRSNSLSLQEFGTASMQIALETGAELDEDGVEVADEDGSGILDFGEFFEYNVTIFEKAGFRVEALANVLNRLANRTKAKAGRQSMVKSSKSFFDPSVEDLCIEAYELLDERPTQEAEVSSDGSADEV